MSLYLIKSSLCLLVMLAAYRFLLEKEKMHRFNRAYLLFSLLFSFLVPLIPMADYFQQARLNTELAGLPAGISRFITPSQPQAGPVSQQAQPIPVRSIPVIGYCLITLGFLVRFIRNLYLIRLRISTNQRIPLEEAQFVLVPEEVVIHTFHKSIFINEAMYREQRMEPEILIHELAHVNQRHTMDILFVEALQVVFWFNPLLILYKRAIRLNHEFLADEAVIAIYKNPKEYQHLLLNKVSPTNHLSLSSPLNYKLTKKRLVMITIAHNPKVILIKKLSIAPLLLCALFLFSTGIDAQQEKPGGITKTDLAVPGTNNLGEHPFVLIDGKEYPSDILAKISPSCISSTATYLKEEAIHRYGAKAADGAVSITTKRGGLSYITATEKENLVKEHAAKTGFYHRVTLKKEDGSSYDKLFINLKGGGAISSWGEKGCKAGFLVGNELFNEDQIGEVEKLLNAMPKPAPMGVGGNTVKRVPGLDLSSYAIIFYF